MNRLWILIVFVLFGSAAGHAQSSYKGLTPGKSSKAEVTRLLGQPLKQLSPTLLEYRPQPLTGRIFVQYRQDSPVVERIEFLCRLQDSNCEDFIKSLNLRLPEGVNSSRSDGDKTRDYYGEPFYIVTLQENEETARLAFYSRELFEATIESNAEKLQQEKSSAPALKGLYGEVTGIVKLKAADGSLQPVAGATVDFYRIDMAGHFQTKTNSNGQFTQVGLSPTGSWAVVASGAGAQWAYISGVKTPSGGLEIVTEPGDGARPTREQVMAAIR